MDDRYPFRDDAPEASVQDLAKRLQSAHVVLAALLRREGGRITISATEFQPAGPRSFIDIEQVGDDWIVKLGEW